jgi:hypothetical protein
MAQLAPGWKVPFQQMSAYRQDSQAVSPDVALVAVNSASNHPGAQCVRPTQSRPGPPLPVTKTTGIDYVIAGFTARALTSPPIATITVSRRATTSEASAGSLSYCPPSQTGVIRTFRPSRKPVSPVLSGMQPPLRQNHLSIGCSGIPVTHWCLLRPWRHRPRRRCAAEQGDELTATNHSITSSARARSVGATATFSALAVFKFSTNSKRVTRSIGKVSGFSPRRIRSA